MIAPYLVDIHGQHEQQTLLDTSKQLAMIDHAAKAGTLRERVQKLYNAIRSLEEALAALEQDDSELLQRADLLRFQREEIEAGRAQEGRDRPPRRKGPNSRPLRKSCSRPLTEGTRPSTKQTPPSLLNLPRSNGVSVTQESTITAWRISRSRPRRHGPLVEDLAYALRDYMNQIEVDPGELEPLQVRLAETGAAASEVRVRPACTPGDGNPGTGQYRSSGQQHGLKFLGN